MSEDAMRIGLSIIIIVLFMIYIVGTILIERQNKRAVEETDARKLIMQKKMKEASDKREGIEKDIDDKRGWIKRED